MDWKRAYIKSIHFFRSRKFRGYIMETKKAEKLKKKILSLIDEKISQRGKKKKKSVTLDWLYFSYHFHHHHHHHHVVLPAQISLTLSRHLSLSFIASGRSSGLHPVSSQSYCLYFRAGHPVFAQPYVGLHRSTTLMSSFLLLQQCPACLGRLTWIVFVMGGRWPYSWCLIGCCLQDMFNIARRILV